VFLSTILHGKTHATHCSRPAIDVSVGPYDLVESRVGRLVVPWLSFSFLGPLLSMKAPFLQGRSRRLPEKNPDSDQSPECYVGAFVVFNLPITLQRSRTQLEFKSSCKPPATLESSLAMEPGGPMRDRLRRWLISMAIARIRRGTHDRADETGHCSGSGCATAVGCRAASCTSRGPAHAQSTHR
jgi:hypothetical protein